MLDVAIVGSGLFGSVIAKALRKEGRSVLIVDDARPDRGSLPAACLMRPSWLSRLGKDVYNPALRLLDELYGLQELRFRTAVKPVAVHWVPPPSILKGADRVTTVEHVSGGKVPAVELLTGERIEARKVVVAAGIWSSVLVAVEGKFYGQAGMACLWPTKRIPVPFIKVWAPYKQITAFNRGDGAWVGDANAIREDNWTEAQSVASETRCANAVGFVADTPQRLFGIRPYSDKSPCYLAEASPNVWVATGGAKNGTVAAAWCAHQLRGCL